MADKRRVDAREGDAGAQPDVGRDGRQNQAADAEGTPVEGPTEQGVDLDPKRRID